MSSIFGIFNRDGSSPDPARLEAMRKAHAYWSPDAEGSWSDGPVALGHCMLWNTPESRLENQPKCSGGAEGITVISADARLDNRKELAGLFDLSNTGLARTSDVDLLLLAWQKWGESCPEYLLGDFAFVIWDARIQSLFCVRDHVGIRPFYYCLTEQIFAFASDIRVLIALDDISRELDSEAVAIYLTEGGLLNSELTFLKAIKKLPAASRLVLEAGVFKRDTYWRLEDAPKLEFDSLEDCAVELRVLLERVVTDRLRTQFPVFSHLSGGLDSSSISAIAARHLAKEDSKLHSFNWVPAPEPGDDPEHFEWANARKVAESEGIVLRNVSLDAEDILEDLRETDIAFGCNEAFWYEPFIRKSVQEKGGRVILSGWGGDELITHHGYVIYGELFWHGRIREAIAGIFHAARNSHRPIRNFSGIFYRQIILPVLPSALRYRLEDKQFTCPDFTQCAQPLFAEFIKQQNFIPYRRPVLSNRAVQLSLFNYEHIQNRVECWASSAWEQRVEYRYPLLDKRLIEFAVGLPTEYYRQLGFGRFVFREACKGLLNEDIRLQRSKNEPRRIEQIIALAFEAIDSLLEEFCQNADDAKTMPNEQFVSLNAILSFKNDLDKPTHGETHDPIDAVDLLVRNIKVLRLGAKLKKGTES